MADKRSNIARFRRFIQSFTALIEGATGEEARVLDEGAQLLAQLLEHDDWLPARFTRPHSQRYRQYLLHCDPLERFSVVSFVWGPGQSSPVHDHTVWGMIGLLRGAETCELFSADPHTGRLTALGERRMCAGEIDRVSPRLGDIHRVSNALTDRPSVSIHVYGANIGAVKRHLYDVTSGDRRTFVSGYSNDVVPNLWDRSGDR